LLKTLESLEEGKGEPLMERFNTAEEPLWTQSDLAAELEWSPSYIQELREDGILVPQFYTLRGVALYSTEYVAWILKNVPRIAKRVSELSARLRE